MSNTDNLSTMGFIRKLNTFLKILSHDFIFYLKRTKLFFVQLALPASLHENKLPAQQKNEKTLIISKSKKIRNMSNLRNSVQLIGRLGKNPEVKQLESGRYVANVTIATNDIYKNAKGEKVIETQWHNLVAWGKNAENFQKILTKGDEVAIQGKLTHRSYEDKDGVTRYVTEVVVNEFVKLSSRQQMAQVA